MNTQELKEKYAKLYDTMATSNNPKYMHTFGRVMTDMMNWMIDYKPDVAQEWIAQLETIKWKNYLTPKEADKIVEAMEPKAPWGKEQWRSAIVQHEFDLENMPYYNQCALWATMNMIMSDSSDTIKKYVGNGDVFAFVYDLAVDKLTDADGKFNIRRYFDL